jgi:hypothetical protein
MWTVPSAKSTMALGKSEPPAKYGPSGSHLLSSGSGTPPTLHRILPATGGVVATGRFRAVITSAIGALCSSLNDSSRAVSDALSKTRLSSKTDEGSRTNNQSYQNRQIVQAAWVGIEVQDDFLSQQAKSAVYNPLLPSLHYSPTWLEPRNGR